VTQGTLHSRPHEEDGRKPTRARELPKLEVKDWIYMVATAADMNIWHPLSKPGVGICLNRLLSPFYK
jgi:hypothetical protein